MADTSRKNLPSGAKPTRHAPALSITSSPRFHCRRCSRLFDSPQALAGHQNAHKHEHQQQYQAAVFFNVWPEHIQPPIISSPLLPCPHCSRLFDSPQALAGHLNAHKRERAAQRSFLATHQQQYQAAVSFNVWPEHIQPPIISSPLFRCPHRARLFDSPQALAGHQNAHRHERAAQRNSPPTQQQQYQPLTLFPADQHQQNTSSIPFPHCLAVSTTTPNALSPTTDVDDSSADIDIAHRL